MLIDTVSCRIDEMGTNIVKQLVDKLRAGETFSLQLDESVDISGQAQLIAFAGYVDTSDIRKILEILYQCVYRRSSINGRLYQRPSGAHKTGHISSVHTLHFGGIK